MTAQDLLMLYCCSWLLSWIGGKRWQKLRDSSQLAWQQHHKRSFMVWRQVELIWSWLVHSLWPLLGQNVLLLGRCAFGKVFSSFNCYRNNYNNVEILEKKYANPTVNFLGVVELNILQETSKNFPQHCVYKKAKTEMRQWGTHRDFGNPKAFLRLTTRRRTYWLR